MEISTFRFRKVILLWFIFQVSKAKRSVRLSVQTQCPMDLVLVYAPPTRRSLYFPVILELPQDNLLDNHLEFQLPDPRVVRRFNLPLDQVAYPPLARPLDLLLHPPNSQVSYPHLFHRHNPLHNHQDNQEGVLLVSHPHNHPDNQEGAQQASHLVIPLPNHLRNPVDSRFEDLLHNQLHNPPVDPLLNRPFNLLISRHLDQRPSLPDSRTLDQLHSHLFSPPLALQTRKLRPEPRLEYRVSIL